MNIQTKPKTIKTNCHFAPFVCHGTHDCEGCSVIEEPDQYQVPCTISQEISCRARICYGNNCPVIKYSKNLKPHHENS
jgi:hypothetical protein